MLISGVNMKINFTISKKTAITIIQNINTAIPKIILNALSIIILITTY
jgi:hypothetical protein